MESARFGALIRSLEQRSHRRPRLYRVQVGLVAGLGYAYVIGLMLMLLVSIAGLGYLALHVGGGAIAVKLIIPLAGLAYVLVRSLWIRVPEVEGIPLTDDRFPALAATIERIRARLDAPHFRRVLLDGNFNAAVAQRPRFGLLGPSVNDLVLGLPLMQALPPLEFEAVLAHEMGHVSRQHGRFGHWIYRIRSTWSRLAAVVSENGGWAADLFLGRFIAWYAPFFNAYSFVLARQDEYEADSSAVRVAGRSAAATALVRIELVGRFHGERYWGLVSRELALGAELPTPHAAFAGAMSERLEPEEAENWLAQALRRATDYGDTHPSLADRLRAVGNAAPPALPPSFVDSAAANLLGTECDTLARDLDARWRALIEPQLIQVRTAVEAARRRLEELDAMAETNVATSWERVLVLERLERNEEARAAAEALVARQPDHVPALLFVGRLRLEADRADGMQLLQRAAALHPPTGAAVQSLLFEYHWRNGCREEAEAARASLERAGRELEAAGRERASLSERPIFVPHGLPSDTVDQFRAALAEVPGLRAAYLVRRIVAEMPQVPCYFVGLVPAQRGWKLRREGDNHRLRDMVASAVEWPESTFIVVGQGSNARLVNRLGKVPGATLAKVGPQVLGPALALDPVELEALRAQLIRRRGRRRRLVPLLLAMASAIILLVSLAYRQRDREIAKTPLRQFTVAEATQKVRDAQGHLVVVVLYNPEEDDKLLVRTLRQWEASLGSSRAEILALAVGDRLDAQEFFFYDALDEGKPTLVPAWLARWRPGTLDSSMAELGIRVGRSWTIPLVAVLDPGGKVVAQWQGLTDPAPVIAAAQRGLLTATGSTQ